MKKGFRMILLMALTAMSLCAAASAQDYYVDYYGDWGRIFMDVGCPEDGTVFDVVLVDSAAGKKQVAYDDISVCTQEYVFLPEGRYDRYEITDSASGAVIEEGELYLDLVIREKAFTYENDVAMVDQSSNDRTRLTFYGLELEEEFSAALVYADGVLHELDEWMLGNMEDVDWDALRKGGTLYVQRTEYVEEGDEYQLQERSMGIPLRLEGSVYEDGSGYAATNPHFVLGGDTVLLVWDRHVPSTEEIRYQIDMSTDGGKTWSEGWGWGNGSMELQITTPGTYTMRIATQVNDETVATCVAEGLTLTVEEAEAKAPVSVRYLPKESGDHAVYVKGLTPGQKYFYYARTYRSGSGNSNFVADEDGRWMTNAWAESVEGVDWLVEHDGEYLIREWTSRTLSADGKSAKIVITPLGDWAKVADAVESVNSYGYTLKLDGPALMLSVNGAEEGRSYTFTYDRRNWGSWVSVEGTESAVVLTAEGVWDYYWLREEFPGSELEGDAYLNEGTMPKMIRTFHEAFVLEDEITAWESKKTVGKYSYYGTQFSGLDFEEYVYILNTPWGEEIPLTEEWINMDVSNLGSCELYACRTTEQSDAFLQERSCAMEVTVLDEPPSVNPPAEPEVPEVPEEPEEANAAVTLWVIGGGTVHIGNRREIVTINGIEIELDAEVPVEKSVTAEDAAEIIMAESEQGFYDVTVTRPGCLSWTIRKVRVGSADVDLGKVLLLAGDTNGDGMINIVDMGIFRQNFGKTGENIANAYTDTNGDKMVNIMDMSTFRTNFGKTAANDCTVTYGT